MVHDTDQPASVGPAPTGPAPEHNYKEQIETIRKDIAELRAILMKDAGERMDEVRHTAHEKFDQAKDVAGEKLGEVETAIRNKPLQSALIAFGIGFMIGLVARR